MKQPDKLVQLNIEIPDQIRRGLKAAAAMRGIPLKDLAAQVLHETATPYVSNSTSPPAAPSAASVTVAALKGLQPTPPVDAPNAATSKPAIDGRKLKGSRR